MRLDGDALGQLAGEGLPTLDRDVAIGRIDVDRVAHPFRHFGGDQRRSRPDKRIVDRLAHLRIVDDRPPHALDRFLRAVAGRVLADPALAAERAGIVDLPYRRLRAVALPMPGLA